MTIAFALATRKGSWSFSTGVVSLEIVVVPHVFVGLIDYRLVKVGVVLLKGNEKETIFFVGRELHCSFVCICPTSVRTIRIDVRHLRIV